jgi:hypothetical protein
MFIALGAAFVMGLALTTYTGYIAYDYSSRKASYDTAKPCASATNLADCRYQGDARIVHKLLPGADPRVELAFVDLRGADVTAYLDRSHRSQWDAFQEGSVVQAELWHGNVTMVAGVPTLDNPDTLPESGPGPALIFGIATLACAGFFVWLVMLNRRSSRAAAPS